MLLLVLLLELLPLPFLLFCVVFVVLFDGVEILGQISVSISAIHKSKWRKSRVRHPASAIFGTLGSGGGSGVDK